MSIIQVIDDKLEKPLNHKIQRLFCLYRLERFYVRHIVLIVLFKAILDKFINIVFYLIIVRPI